MEFNKKGVISKKIRKSFIILLSIVFSTPITAMATGWINVDGKWYYLYGDGSLALSTVINGYIVDENGVWENR
jgi:hypothetical protein